MKSGIFKLFFGLLLVAAVVFLVLYIGANQKDSKDDERKMSPSEERVTNLRNTAYKSKRDYRDALERKGRKSPRRERRSVKRNRMERRATAPSRSLDTAGKQNTRDTSKLRKTPQDNKGKAAGQKSETQQKATREEILYKVRLFAAKPSAAVKQVLRAIKKTKAKNAPQSLSIGKTVKVDVPREAYLDFVDNISAAGKLKIDRKRFQTTEPSSAPIPFEITVDETAVK